MAISTEIDAVLVDVGSRLKRVRRAAVHERW